MEIGKNEERRDRQQQPIQGSSLLSGWIDLTFVPDRVGDVEFPEV